MHTVLHGINKSIHGKPCQAAIKAAELEIGDYLGFELQPDNRIAATAGLVGKQYLGYLDPELAEQYAPSLAAGEIELTGQVTALPRGENDLQFVHFDLSTRAPEPGLPAFLPLIGQAIAVIVVVALAILFF